MEIFKDEFRCITMDQRNANGGEPGAPILAAESWNAFADDQLGLMDHLGIKQCLFMGYYIGGRFALKLMERAPERVMAGVLVQTVGHHPQHPDYMFNSGRDVWAPELLPRRPDLNMEQVAGYLHDLYRVPPAFVYSMSPDFARSCQTPILVLPDETPAHPLVSSVDVASFCPNAEITVFPWREPPELKARAINRVRSFLGAHRPAS
jgi:pimeloyl-ACP methyl ester carboxylesterase